MIQEVTVLFFLFTALYFEVFMLLTLIEQYGRLKSSPLADISNPDTLLSLTVVVPCFNEEKTVARTVESILGLDYPQSKLFISIVDDGSTDHTWEYINRWKGHPQIQIHQKKNGGKYTALNYGIEHATTDLVGCLDADSFVAPDALRKMVKIFNDNPKIMAVAPAVKIWKPDNFLRSIQFVEYTYGILIKKLFCLLDAVHVTPGPFSLFRRELFKEIGLFKHAHNTEDMEIAMRMQKNLKLIGNCHDAYVYTIGPKTFRALHRQRLRWTYGFIKNAFDYRSLYFNRKFGNVGFITLPFSTIGLIGTIASLFFLIYNMSFGLLHIISRLRVTGIHLSWPHVGLDWFFVSTSVILFVGIYVFLIAIAMIIISQYVTRERIPVHNTAFYFAIYPLLAITWITRSFYNVIFARVTSWR